MEINNKQKGVPDDVHIVFGSRVTGVSNIIPGLILVGIGALFLLGNLHIIPAIHWFDYWPVILIAVGLVQLIDASATSGRIMGATLLGLGGLFLADNLGYLSFQVGDLWPLILIAVGVTMLWNRTHWGWRAVEGRSRGWVYGKWAHPTPDTDTRGFVHEAAIFSGGKRVITSQEFVGGHVTAIFGGLVLDLRGADIKGDAARLNVAAIWGGMTVKVPPTWEVDMRGTGIFGGMSDRTIHPPAGLATKRLIVKGAAMFGGVDVRN
jgi:hypothetical protein